MKILRTFAAIFALAAASGSLGAVLFGAMTITAENPIDFLAVALLWLGWALPAVVLIVDESKREARSS